MSSWRSQPRASGMCGAAYATSQCRNVDGISTRPGESRLCSQVGEQRRVVRLARRRVGARERDAVDGRHPLPDEQRDRERGEHEPPAGEQCAREERARDVLAEPADVAAERGGDEERSDRDGREARGAPARGRVAPQRGRDDRAQAQVPDERPRFVRLGTRGGEEQRDGRDRQERGGRDHERPACVARAWPIAHATATIARKQPASGLASEASTAPATAKVVRRALQRVDRAECERDTERVGGATDDEVDHGGEREPEAAEPRDRSEREAQDAFEHERRRDAAQRAERDRAERCTDGRSDDAVAEQRVAAEPLAVPEDEAVLAEQLGSEDLRGKIGAAPAEGDRRGSRARPRPRRPRCRWASRRSGPRARARRNREGAAHHCGPAARARTRERLMTTLCTPRRTVTPINAFQPQCVPEMRPWSPRRSPGGGAAGAADGRGGRSESHHESVRRCSHFRLDRVRGHS